MIRLKGALGISGFDKDGLLEFVLRAAEAQVLAYINHPVLPEGLESVLVLIAASYWKSAGLGGAQAAAGPMASVKRGDVTVSYASAGGAEASASTFGLGGGDGFFGWRTALNTYRKLRW